MRKRHVLARQSSEGTSSGGYTSVRPVRGSRRDPLALPNISSAIPIVYDGPMADPQWATLALEWLDAGYVPEDSQEGVKGMVRTAFKEWLSQKLGETECLADMNHCLAESAETYVQWAAQLREDTTNEDWLYGVSVNGMPDPRYLEAIAADLECKFPGLMETALYWLGTMASQVAWKGGTPSCFRDVATYLYWNGATTMDEWKGEMEMMGEDVEEDNEEFFSPDDFDKGFPSWVIDPSPRIGTKRLKQLTRHHDGQVAEIAKCCIALAAAAKQRVYMPRNDLIDAELVYPLFFLRWNETDPLMRVCDDMVQQANDCGDCYTDIACTWEFPKTSEGFSAWKKQAEAGLAVLRDINRLIEQISRPGDLS